MKMAALKAHLLELTIQTFALDRREGSPLLLSSHTMALLHDILII